MTYYRVFDHQRGLHFATGYNSQSMQELIDDFRSYILQDNYSHIGECGLNSWEDIANHLTEVTLEESEEKFEENWSF